jgi:hypothetical protein
VGERGLPEAELGSFDAAQLRGALLEHGCLLVPGALPPERCAELAAAIDRGFEAQDPERDASAAGAWWAPLQLEPEAAVGLGRKWVRGGGGVLLADSPRLMAAVLDLYTAVGLRDLVRAYLGGRPVLSANKCTLRRVAPTTNGDWHQDGAFLGRGIRALNLWVTLTPCGVDAPGLDVVPRRLDGIVETGTGGAYFDWAVGPALVESTAGPGGVLRPEFEAGDLMIFDDLFLHRTAVAPEMRRDRHAIELWSFAADAYPAGQVPLVW